MSSANGTIDLARLEDGAAKLVAAARKAGADACDVVVAHGQSLGIEIRDGKVENTSRSEDDQFSLRVFVGNKVASVNANTADGMDELAGRAVAMARVSPEDAYQGLAPRERIASSFADLDLFDPVMPDAAELTGRAMECEAAGLAVDGVAKSMGARASWGLSGFVLATSDGFEGHYAVTRHSASASLVAGEGTAMERDYDYHVAVHAADLESMREIGRRAGERTVRRLNPRQVPSMAVPVIFDRRVASSLLSSLAGAINGASIARKTSFLRNSMGKKIADTGINVICDPTLPRGLGSRPFDGEGQVPRPIRFVEDGVLAQWVLDWAAARELGLESNNRAARSGSGTSPSTTNLRLEPGSRTPAEMIASIGTGLFVTETIGHGVNMVTGDFSKGATGFWVENGELAYPVAGITIAGNLADMFKTMIPANDLEIRGATNSPTLLVERMTLGGT
ncbi:MAG: TldD/PmbA family protein [Nitratireductor sp.]|nr:TldD/PmbA family protein [Nitratireductor sp.]MCB1455481.1 TldD/PmbA family protein [Nitratireductor sp.]